MKMRVGAIEEDDMGAIERRISNATGKERVSQVGLSEAEEKRIERNRKRKRSKQQVLDEEKGSHPMLGPCGCKQKQCETKITEQERRDLHNAFWKQKYGDRRKWLCRHMQNATKKKVCQQRYNQEKYKSNLSFPDERTL